MYEQVYLPKINTPAAPAMCLGYIDDGGNAPDRSPTAKAAYLKEKNAGRISLAQLPDNVWVVVWFSFSKGSYTYSSGHTVYYKDAWHVAFARRKGNSVEIHDSEVHSGSRQPYTALAAVEAWFGAYGAKSVGWSTHCGGREYARKEDEMISVGQIQLLVRVINGRGTTKDEEKKFGGKVTMEEMIKICQGWQSYKDEKTKAKKPGDFTDHLPVEFRESQAKYIAELKKGASAGLTQLKPGRYEVK